MPCFERSRLCVHVTVVTGNELDGGTTLPNGQVEQKGDVHLRTVDRVRCIPIDGRLELLRAEERRIAFNPDATGLL